jgi:hypothetical protein
LLFQTRVSLQNHSPVPKKTGARTGRKNGKALRSWARTTKGVKSMGAVAVSERNVTSHDPMIIQARNQAKQLVTAWVQAQIDI